jgi:SAM-dependent methyltransferase
MNEAILNLESLPFCVGACSAPHNPSQLPDTYPLQLELDEQLSLLRVRQTPALERLLSSAYRLGALMGTPLADTELGVGYVSDFLSFIHQHRGTPGRALEIGAGTGYLSSRLKQSGWQIDALEPGEGYQAWWRKYELDVICDFFPSPAAHGPYDAIISYAVLEHMSDPLSVLREARAHLAPDGLLLLSVPDCHAEIAAGDPAMLLHEHYSYFDKGSLARCMQSAGFHVEIVRPAGYGRSLYAAARPDSAACIGEVDDLESQQLREFGRKCAVFLRAVAGRVDRLRRENRSLGIYCPSRALAVLPTDISLRFFDDAPELHGKYYPPFDAAVESRAELIARPTDEIWIMSRTFGAKLATTLQPLLPRTKILLADEVASDAA